MASNQNRFGKKIYPNASTIDVINQYRWFYEPSLTAEEKELIPKIILTEYQMSQNGLYSTLKFYTTATKQAFSNNDTNPYKDLYSANKTGMKFIFPYLNEMLDNHSSAWQVAKDITESTGLDIGGVVKNATKFVNDAIKAYKTVRTIFQKDKVSSYKVSPYVWKSTMGMHPTINFTLFNTPLEPNEDIMVNYEKNQKLVNYLRLASTFDQIGPFEAAPPSIFTVQIPGIYYMPAATIESFQLKSVGSVITKNKKLIPEGFDITIILQPLVPSSHAVTYAGGYSYDENSEYIKDVQAITKIVTEEEQAINQDTFSAASDSSKT